MRWAPTWPSKRNERGKTRLSAGEFRRTDRWSPRAGAALLVADDEPNLRDTYSEILGLAGHQVDIASNGDEVVEKYFVSNGAWLLP